MRLKAYSQYSIHFWPSTILNLKDRQLICWDPRPPVHANGHPIPWTRTSSLCNLSAECSDDVHFRHNCRLLPSLVASFSVVPACCITAILRHRLYIGVDIRAYLSLHASTPPYMHANSRSVACSSRVFCRLDSHQRTLSDCTIVI